MKLDDILRDVQRVRTLLLIDSQQSLGCLNLDQYTVLDCEPLHNLKHFRHLLEDLPFLLGADEAGGIPH